MSPIATLIIAIVAALVAGAAGMMYGRRYQRRLTEAKERELGGQARTIIQEAEAQAKETTLKAMDEAINIRNQAEEEAVRRLAELGKEDQRLIRRREDLDRKGDQMEQRRTQLDKRQTLQRLIRGGAKLSDQLDSSIWSLGAGDRCRRRQYARQNSKS